MTVDLRDRYAGCLLGLAVGDALGGPLEFMGREQIPIKLGRVTEMIGGGWLGLRPGETTDVTAMATLLAQSLAETGGFDAGVVARRYRDWLRGAPKDVEPVTRAALEALDEGYDHAEAAGRAANLSTDAAASNGTLARAVPIALAFRTTPELMLRTAAAEAGLTHADRRCAGGSAAVTALLQQILTGETDRAAIVDGAFDSLETVVDAIPNVLPDASGKTEWALRPDRFVVDTLETALVCWYRAEDPESCLVRTINLGGESAATGALAGALAGATWGASAIPGRWAESVQDGRSLVRLAAKLLERSESPGR